MASELVQRFRNDVAPRLLAKFGNGGVGAVVRVVMPSTDPLAPPITDSQIVEFNAVARGVSAEMIASDPNLVGTDLQVICAAIDYIPVVGGMVSINGAPKLVLRVDPIPASGDPAAYRFYLR